MLPPVIFKILLMSAAVICKQKPSHGNEIVLYLQKYNSYDFDQDPRPL